MDAAAGELYAVYAALGRSERCQDRVYDAPHRFNARMQEEAFAWLEQWLRR